MGANNEDFGRRRGISAKTKIISRTHKTARPKTPYWVAGFDNFMGDLLF